MSTLDAVEIITISVVAIEGFAEEDLILEIILPDEYILVLYPEDLEYLLESLGLEGVEDLENVQIVLSEWTDNIIAPQPPADPVDVPAQPPTPPPPPAPPVVPPLPPPAPPTQLDQAGVFTITTGPQAGQTIYPTFEMVEFGGGAYASAFIAAAAIGSILEWSNAWNQETQQGTFFLPDGRVVVFTNGSNEVLVNGVSQQMANADGSPANAYISPANDRFMIHIRFFEQLGVNINWLGGEAGQASLTVTP
jgi:hypothetical protein